MMPESRDRDVNNHDSSSRNGGPTSSWRNRQSRPHQALQNATAPATSNTATSRSINNTVLGTELISTSRDRRQRFSPESQDEVSIDVDISTAHNSTREHRSKRPRLMIDSPSSSAAPAIRYGHYGQVQAGRLRMDVISCDGGEHTDLRYPNISLSPQNILVHDKSVYCSVSADSTITLGHADNLPFCLEKIHILGPENGFTAPVRRGSVHIAMTLRALQPFHDPPSYARRSLTNPNRVIRALHSSASRTTINTSGTHSERLSLSDALHDAEINHALDRQRRSRNLPDNDPRDTIISMRESTVYSDDDSETVNDPSFDTFLIQDTQTDSDNSDNPDGPNNPDNRDSLVNSTCTSSWTTTMDDDPGEEDASSPTVLEFRHQRLRATRRRYDAESFDELDRMNLSFDHRQEMAHLLRRDRTRDEPFRVVRSSTHTPLARSSHHDHDHDNDHDHHRLRSWPTTVAISANDVSRSSSCQTRDSVVSAEFDICHGHKVTIHFQPAISGRYILLKLTSNKTNVDVQSVIAVGYGGQRFFPAAAYL